MAQLAKQTGPGQASPLLITPDYQRLQQNFHEEKKEYGAYSNRWASFVGGLAAAMNTTDVLDYGCGKCTLGKSMPHIKMKNYDPAIPYYSKKPEPADLVVCSDVLEHIEPHCLDAVLDDLRSLTKIKCFLFVATVPARKTLPDGRNAHLIVEPYTWWLPKIWQRWTVDQFQNLSDGHTINGFLAVVG